MVIPSLSAKLYKRAQGDIEVEDQGMPGNQFEGASNRQAQRKMKPWRWGILTLIVCLGISAFWVEVCEEQLPQNSTKPVKVCRSLAVTDIPVVAAAFGAILLALPLFSEFSIFGITLKKAIEENVRKTEALGERVAQLATAQAKAASYSKVNLQFLSKADAESAPRELEKIRKVALPDEGKIVKVAIPDQEEMPESALEAMTKIKLLQVWEQLRPYVEVRPGPPEYVYGLPVRDPARDFRESQYAGQIRLVQKARNSVAHGVPIPEGFSIGQIVEMAERLLAIARENY